jgi:hypothetical protein
MHIEILRHPTKGFQIRLIDADGETIAMFIYPTIESARGAARSWTIACDNCPIVDKAGVKE